LARLWLTPAILATQRAEIRRLSVQSLPYLEKPITKKEW
jgi:hypothetical protein